MIQMTMRQQDAMNRQRVPAMRLQCRTQCTPSTNESGINEIKRILIPKDKKLHEKRAHNEQIRRHADPHRLESLFS